MILRASHDHPVWTEVDDSGVEEKRPVGATRGVAGGVARVMQFTGEVHPKAVRFGLVTCIEDDVPGGLLTRWCLHGALEERQCDRSSGRAGGEVDSRQS